MNKVILVMDDPMRCIDCPLAKYKHRGSWLCGIGNNAIDVDSMVRPDWCPLKEAPERDEVCRLLEWGAGYKSGWNDCVNYVTSGTTTSIY